MGTKEVVAVGAESIQRVGVVGCGLMGSGIAEVCARKGRSVTVVELDPGALARGRNRIEASIRRAVSAGKLTEEEGEAALGRIELGTDVGALGDCQLVVEAVVEAEPEKVRVFEALDKVVEAPDALLTYTFVDPRIDFESREH